MTLCNTKPLSTECHKGIVNIVGTNAGGGVGVGIGGPVQCMHCAYTGEGGGGGGGGSTALFLRPFSAHGNLSKKFTTIHRNKTVLKCIKFMFLH